MSKGHEATRHAPRHFAIVPAAGVGSRLGRSIPKQYLTIAGRSLLQWAVAPLVRAPWIDRIVIVVAPDDPVARRQFEGSERVEIAGVGGATRRDSVLAGLAVLGRAAPEDWVLVHDAARPGLDDGTLARLRDAVWGDAVGGLLALPIADTVKREGGDVRVAQTVDRAGLWAAQTPQMFRYAALAAALERHADVTDESSALEADGLRPLLVEGSRGNFKVTTEEDFALMTNQLANRPVPRNGGAMR